MARRGMQNKKKAARKEYVHGRELGNCYLHEKGCQDNGDFIDACSLCDFKVQSCTAHHAMGKQKARQHLFLKHPTKAVPLAVMGIFRK